MMAGHQGRILIGLGVLFVCLVGLKLVYLGRTGRLDGTVPLLIVLIQLGLGLAIVHSGRVVGQNSFDRKHERLILGWSIGGFVGLVALGSLLILRSDSVGTGMALYADLDPLLTAGELGFAGGLGLGYQRATLRQKQAILQTQRDSFAFLNRMLRHHVLNGISIIQGYAESVRTDGAERSTDSAELIIDRSEEISRLIERVGQMAQVFAGEAQRRRIDLTALLNRLLELKRDQYPTVEFTADIPKDVDVVGTELIASGIEELVDNAVSHNDSPVPELGLTVETNEAVARIQLTDNGPGFDASILESLAEPGEYGDEGSGLYLVHRLVTQIGGDLNVRNNEDGATVTLELPRSQDGDPVE